MPFVRDQLDATPGQVARRVLGWRNKQRGESRDSEFLLDESKTGPLVCHDRNSSGCPSITNLLTNTHSDGQNDIY